MTLPPAAAVSAAALLTLLPLLTPAALAAPQQDEPPMVEGVEYLSTVEGISEYRLPNGLKILLFPDASRPTVTVNCTVFVGSRHEGYGETGMAHLLEHMVFKGTPTFENVPKELQDRGAVFNGSTWLDRTNYYETLPATDGNLEFAIHLEADRLVNSYVKQEDLDSEMTVVRNEFERGENSPSRVLMQRMLAVAFEWHNYGKSTIGNRADIERVPIENLRAFYERFYQPDNAMLIVAGSFDPVKALRYAKEHFGSIPKPDRTLPSTYTEEPPQDGERTVILRRVGDVARTGAVYHVPAGSDPAFAAVDVLESILTDNPSGRLYKQLVETKRAASVSGGTFALHDPGVILVQAEVAEGNDPRDVLQTLLDTVEGVPDEPVTKIEVDRAKRRLLAARERSANNTTRIAVNLSEWAAQGDWRLYFLYRDRLEAVGVADVQAVADRFLRADNRTAGLFLPTEQPQGVTVPARPDLAELLKDYEGREVAAGGEAFDPDPRAIENRVTRTVLPSGLKVVLLPKATRGDTVAARLTFRYGNERTLQGRAMAAQLLPSLLLRGTETLTRQQIQDRLDELQASVRAGGGPGSVTFTITAKKDTLLPVLDLIGDVLAHATLPPDELELLRQATLARVEQNRSEPQALAPTAVQRALSAYPDPADPRYVPTPTEQAEMVRGVEPADVTAIYEELLTDAVGELAVVGSFDPDAVLAAAEENLAGWAGGDAPPFARLPREVRPDAPSGDTTIPTPDKKSAVYFAGLTAPISDAHPDYPALLIGNYVLGSSGLSSRLGDRVRQRDGLSYGISSGLQARARDDYTLFYLFAIANPENVPALKAAIREEVERLIAEGATPEEVEAAKTSYLQKQRVTRAADASLASSLATQAYHDRTMAFAAEREDAVAALTAEQVNAALRTWLDPEALFIAVAGDLDVPPADDAAPGVGPWRSEAAVPSCGAAIPSRGAATVRERPCRRGPRERRSLTVAAPTRPRLQPRPSLTRRVGRVSAVRFPRRVPPMSAPLALAAALPVLFGAPAPAEPPPASPPNVLLIVVDDLGAYDLGCCSEEDAPLHETPRIDALAAAGTRFRQAYAAASVCSPTRGGAADRPAPRSLRDHGLDPRRERRAPQTRPVPPRRGPARPRPLGNDAGGSVEVQRLPHLLRRQVAPRRRPRGRRGHAADRSGVRGERRRVPRRQPPGRLLRPVDEPVPGGGLRGRIPHRPARGGVRRVRRRCLSPRRRRRPSAVLPHAVLLQRPHPHPAGPRDRGAVRGEGGAAVPRRHAHGPLPRRRQPRPAGRPRIRQHGRRRRPGRGHGVGRVGGGRRAGGDPHPADQRQRRAVHPAEPPRADLQRPAEKRQGLAVRGGHPRAADPRRAGRARRGGHGRAGGQPGPVPHRAGAVRTGGAGAGRDRRRVPRPGAAGRGAGGPRPVVALSALPRQRLVARGGAAAGRPETDRVLRNRRGGAIRSRRRSRRVPRPGRAAARGPARTAHRPVAPAGAERGDAARLEGRGGPRSGRKRRKRRRRRIVTAARFVDHLNDPVTSHLRTTLARLPAEATVAAALAAVRADPPPGRVIYFYAVDAAGKLTGVVPTRKLLLAEPDATVADLAVTAVTIPAAATVADACEFFILHRLLAFPVVDPAGTLLGVVDVELYTDELSELSELDRRAADDELFQLIGVHVEDAKPGGAFAAFRSRFPWLLANVAGGLAAAGLTGLFQAELEQVVALALFVPVVLALAESVAIQSVSLTLQRLRGRHPGWRGVWRRVKGEAAAGGLLGLACGAAVAGVGLLWLGRPGVAVCLLGGIAGGVTVAAAAGAAVPALLKLVHREPQVAAGPTALAVTDLATLLIYFGLARAVFG